MARRESPEIAATEQLREIILRRKLVPFRLAKAAGVAPSVVTRFLKREVLYLTGPTFDRLASALGVHLAEGRGGLR